MAKLFTVSSLSFYCVFALSFLVLNQAEVSDNNNTLTFKWYDNVRAEKVEPDYSPHQWKHLAQLTSIYKKINGSFLLEGTNFTSEYPDSISWRQSTGFVDTVFYSYQKHHNLIIRPDDVWTAIVIQFSLYVNANAEALRHSFVNFEGKKELEVTFYAPIDQIPVNEFIDKIVSLIGENVEPSITRWIRPNFTTTTVNDQLAAGAALMATLQAYFDYKVSLVLCGIPEVTILGDLEDWIDIRQRVDKLREFELNGQDVMNAWSGMLGRILDEFVKVKKNEPKDDRFWKQAIRVDYEMVYEGCSGSNETFLNGWITAFTAFDRSGKWRSEGKTFRTANGLLNTRTADGWLRIRTDEITAGVVQVPVKIYDEFAKPEQRNYTGAIVTGHMGHSVKPDGRTLQPLSGWAMTITNQVPDYLKKSRIVFTK